MQLPIENGVDYSAVQQIMNGSNLGAGLEWKTYALDLYSYAAADRRPHYGTLRRLLQL